MIDADMHFMGHEHLHTAFGHVISGSHEALEYQHSLEFWGLYFLPDEHRVNWIYDCR